MISIKGPGYLVKLLTSTFNILTNQIPNLWSQLQTDRQTERQSFDWSTSHVTQTALPGNPPTFNHQTHTKDTDEEGFPLVLTEFVHTNGLQEERLRLVLFVRRTAFQFVVVNPTILSDTLTFYTETKTRKNI